ncbi:prepilin-type N-terminal cleavage/methylation domain-containing protein, partial [Candidatus Gracilibacteria bacterium]|nr:prepilin-type N-terminal cleavage/methylation domain-containing protein [Candidatus Gracilibacteria bacterium]
MNKNYKHNILIGIKSKLYAFSLIELIIAVSISSLLMLSIMIFTGNSIKESVKNEYILTQDNNNLEFEQKILDIISNTSQIYYSGSIFGEYLTGIFLKSNSSNLPITFIGLKTFTGYCDVFSGTENATGTVQKLFIKEFILPDFIQNQANIGGINYTLSHTGNIIYSGSEIIIGTGYPGDNLDKNNPLKTELNYPSAIIGSGGYLYIADTLNDRILFYDTGSKITKELLGKENGVSRPISLYFSGNELLIANNGNNKILSYKDGDQDGETLNLTFKVGTGFTNINKISFTFSGITNITLPNSTGSFVFSGITGTGINDFINTGSNLTYNFSGGLTNFLTRNIYGININGIEPIPTNTGYYYLKVDFFSGSELKYSDYFPYFTKGDGDFNSITGNVLKTLSGGFSYAYNITGP